MYADFRVNEPRNHQEFRTEQSSEGLGFTGFFLSGLRFRVEGFRVVGGGAGGVEDSGFFRVSGCRVSGSRDSGLRLARALGHFMFSLIGLKRILFINICQKALKPHLVV